MVKYDIDHIVLSCDDRSRADIFMAHQGYLCFRILKIWMISLVQLQPVVSHLFTFGSCLIWQLRVEGRRVCMREDLILGPVSAHVNRLLSEPPVTKVSSKYLLQLRRALTHDIIFSYTHINDLFSVLTGQSYLSVIIYVCFDQNMITEIERERGGGEPVLFCEL